MKKIKLIFIVFIVVFGISCLFFWQAGADNDWEYCNIQLVDEIYIGDNINNMSSLVGWEGAYNSYNMEQSYPMLTEKINKFIEQHIEDKKEVFFLVSWGKPLAELRYQNKYIAANNSVSRYIGFPVYQDIPTNPVMYLYCTDMLNIWDYGHGGSDILYDEYNLDFDIVIKDSSGKYRAVKPPYDEFIAELRK